MSSTAALFLLFQVILLSSCEKVLLLSPLSNLEKSMQPVAGIDGLKIVFYLTLQPEQTNGLSGNVINIFSLF